MRSLALIIISLIHLNLSAQDPAQQNTTRAGKGIASYTFKAAYTDTYLFRGHVFNNDNTMLGEVGIGIGKWYYNLWYAEPTTDTFGVFENEFNHQISYTTVQGGRITTIGYQAFQYEGMPEDTQEFFTRVSHLTKWRPTYGISYDFDAYKGIYVDYEISRHIPVTRKSRLQFILEGGIAYDLEEELDEDGEKVIEPGFFGRDGFTSASVIAKYLWSPLDWLNLEVGGQYHYAFDDALFESNPELEEDTTIWRAGITVRFP